MSSSSLVSVWAAQVRAPFLILAVLLVLVGNSLALGSPEWSLWKLLGCLIGVVLAHASVNLFNELSDHQTGIDARTERTPFSGGSGQILAGHTSPQAVRWAAWGTLLGAGVIGLALAWSSSWWVLALALAGGLASRFYTTHLARWGLGEVVAGLCLGSFVVVGTVLVLSKSVTLDTWMVSIVPGILTAGLLFLNEFPDVEADRAGGRRHLVIRLGLKWSSVLFGTMVLAVVAGLVIPVVLGLAPKGLLLGLLALPLAIRSFSILRRGEFSAKSLTPALGANVGWVLGTDALIAAGIWVSALGSTV